MGNINALCDLFQTWFGNIKYQIKKRVRWDIKVCMGIHKMQTYMYYSFLIPILKKCEPKKPRRAKYELYTSRSDSSQFLQVVRNNTFRTTYEQQARWEKVLQVRTSISDVSDSKLLSRATSSFLPESLSCKQHRSIIDLSVAFMILTHFIPSFGF